MKTYRNVGCSLCSRVRNKVAKLVSKGEYQVIYGCESCLQKALVKLRKLK